MPINRTTPDRYLNDHIAFYAQTADRDTAAANQLYDIMLLQKSLALRNYASFLQRAGKIRPKEVNQLVSLRNARNTLQLRNNTYEWSGYSAVDSLNQAVIQAERSLLAKLPTGSSLAEKPVRWFQVRQMLKTGPAADANEAAVEFIRFVLPDSSIQFSALVLTRSDRSPHYVPLCTSWQWAALTKQFTKFTNPQAFANAFYQNRELYKLVWQPLERWLTAARIVYLSPVNGFANELAFAAITLPDGSVLATRKTIRPIISTAQISARTIFNLSKKPVRALLIGGVDYTCDGYEYAGLVDLPGTRADIKQAEHYIQLKAGSSVRTLKDTQATEAAFLAEAAHPLDLLHIATHGFNLKTVATSLPDSLNALAAQSDPEYQTGLTLAGAACVWRDGRGLGSSDGILTTREIRSALTLNAELVVLSACESALGKEEGSEGLLGLFRAFKSAGANYIMATLWDVNDTATSTFIELFYGALVKPTSTVESAFDAAQAAMRNNKNPASQWASFILLR